MPPSLNLVTSVTFYIDLTQPECFHSRIICAIVVVQMCNAFF